MISYTNLLINEVVVKMNVAQLIVFILSTSKWEVWFSHFTYCQIYIYYLSLKSFKIHIKWVSKLPKS